MFTKRCSKCHEIKPLNEFNKESRSSDGHRPDCRACQKKRQKKYRDKSDVKKRQQKYQRKHREKFPERHRRWKRRKIQRNPLMSNAHNAVYYAVKRGELPRPSECICDECGASAECYHHYAGYDREHWLSVIPLCNSCHRFLHANE